MSARFEPSDGAQVHPSAEELVAYHEGGLGPDEKERLVDHLLLCRECAGTVLGLGAMDSIEKGPVRVDALLSDSEVEAQWVAFEPDSEADAASNHTVNHPAVRYSILADSRLAWLTAAVVLVAVIGLGASNLSLRTQLREPRPNVLVHDLVPVQELEARRGAPSPLELPSEAEHLLLLFNVSDPDFSETVALEIRDSAGHPVWRSDKVHRSRDGNYTLELPRRFLTAGRYRCLLIESSSARVPGQIEYILEIVDENDRALGS